MLARIVDNWLTNAGELGYQHAFAQLLASEGHRVLHGPVHHPFEHGKDIVTYAPDGKLHAYQLKGGDIGLGNLEAIQGQLFALAGTVVNYPGVEPPKRPDRVHLVTNGRLTAPARDRLSAFNDANRPLGFPPVEVVEREQLVGRFVFANGNFFPTDPAEINRFLEIYLSDGRGLPDKRKIAAFLRDVIGDMEGAAPSQAKRAISSATLFAAYLCYPWRRHANHLGIAEVWLVLALTILHAAESRALEDGNWVFSYGLAFEAARTALLALLAEAADSEDLVIPHFVEGLVYPTRAATVCGYIAGLFISEHFQGDEVSLQVATRTVLLRERPFAQATGEAGLPHIVLIARALELLGDPVLGGYMVSLCAQQLAQANQPGSSTAVPDPYHSVEEVLMDNLGADTSIGEESFGGEAYTLHVLLDWLARRNYREQAAKLFPAITHIHLCEFQPTAAGILAHEDESGSLKSWALPQPTSWAELRRKAIVLRESELPTRLWQHLEIAPFLALVYPYRFTAALGKAIDYITQGNVTISYDDDVPTNDTAT